MSKKFTVTVSDDLHEALEILRKRNGYKSRSDYVNGLVRYDARVQKEHSMTQQDDTLGPWERDNLDKMLLELVKSGKGIKGAWFENRIDDAIKRARETAGREPTKEEVIQELRQQE